MNEFETLMQELAGHKRELDRIHQKIDATLHKIQAHQAQLAERQDQQRRGPDSQPQPGGAR